MKQVHPICELHLSFDGIALMHHADGAWSRVHNIDLDPDTLERDMADLRNHVQSLSHEQAAVNLVLPQDQNLKQEKTIKTRAAKAPILF